MKILVMEYLDVYCVGFLKKVPLLSLISIIPLENVERATMDSVTSWDSIGQMSLIAMLEETFNIELKPDDIIGINSYKAGFVILKKYGIEI